MMITKKRKQLRHEDSSSLCEGNGELCLLGSCVLSVLKHFNAALVFSHSIRFMINTEAIISLVTSRQRSNERHVRIDQFW